MAILKRLAPELKGSITFDDGSEFARHGLLASVSGMTTWFCDAYASWPIRSPGDRSLPNLTPGKCLGYLTPIQALLKGLGKDIRIQFT